MNNNLETKIALLERDLVRHNLIMGLFDKINACDEDAKECDVCLGLRYAINFIDSQLEWQK